MVTCSVCGALIEILEVSPEIGSQKAIQEPLEEITQRVEAFARLRNYEFNENMVLVMEGLMGKWKAYGDFYCPCRFDNLPENLCPCREARMNWVRKEGECRCGLFILPPGK
jgi:ferredoxin-thioredoxin reductase catalytic subunit